MKKKEAIRERKEGKYRWKRRSDGRAGLEEARPIVAVTGNGERGRKGNVGGSGGSVEEQDWKRQGR